MSAQYTVLRFLARAMTTLGVMVIMSLVLVSCGGGGGGSGTSYNYGNTPVYYSISGKVTSGGTGLAGVTLSLSGASTASVSTDANGNYAFASLANGAYTITPSKTGFTFTPSSSAHTVNGANITGSDFTATATTLPTFSMAGTVTLGGTGLAGATLTLSGSGSGTTTSDAGGNYTFTGLANGNYTVTPSKSGFSFTPANSAKTLNGANITGVDFAATSLLTVQSVACPGSGTTDVSIQDFLFNPANISVSVNTIVRWTNNGAADHTVTSTGVPANGSFDSGTMGPGASACFKFTALGTFNYHCAIHSTMVGAVTVQ